MCYQNYLCFFLLTPLHNSLLRFQTIQNFSGAIQSINDWMLQDGSSEQRFSALMDIEDIPLSDDYSTDDESSEPTSVAEDG